MRLSQQKKKIFSVLILFSLCALATSGLQVYKVREYSMEPTLIEGQKILVLNSFFEGSSFPRRGDLVIYSSPYNGKKVVKRCILLPGDPVVIEQGNLTALGTHYFLSLKQMQMIRSYKMVPEGFIFAAGDNQFHSLDSREYGLIPIKSLNGRVIYPTVHEFHQ